MKSIQEAVASVQNAFPSVYTKDDVIKLLESVEIPAASSKPILSEEMIKELTTVITAATSRIINRLDASDIVELDTAEFELSWDNRLELTGVDINTDSISDEIETAVQDAINEFFEDEEKSDCDIENDVVELEKA